MSKPQPPLDQAVRFITWLGRYQSDRGALANLRAALSPARRDRAWPLLGGYASAIGDARFEIVAALWAGSPGLCAPDSENLGDTLSRLSSDHKSFDMRFQRLLTCDRDEVAVRVAAVVRAAQAQGIPVSYVRLLSDLLYWGDDVKLRWARSFWGAAEAVLPSLDDTAVDESLDATSGTLQAEAQA